MTRAILQRKQNLNRRATPQLHETPTTYAPSFDLHHTLNSGQVFRYRRSDDRYIVCSTDKLFWLRQHGETLEYCGVDETFIRCFLGIDHDIAPVIDRLRKFPQLQPALETCRGLRIVKHDPWECLVSFICSANSNIPKIQRSLNLLARRFGRPIKIQDMEDYSFPKIGSLNDLKGLRSTGIGYRAKYLFDTNAACNRHLLKEIESADYNSAREILKTLPGVGDKVADCVCLFGLGHHEAFPVDVWVQRAMLEFFPGGCGKTERDIRRFAADTFGADAGYAQQYLFHYLRNHTTRSRTA